MGSSKIQESVRLIHDGMEAKGRDGSDRAVQPLNEIAPNVRHPILKKTINELFNEL